MGDYVELLGDKEISRIQACTHKMCGNFRYVNMCKKTSLKTWLMTGLCGTILHFTVLYRIISVYLIVRHRGKSKAET
jgi:hypothetical protein